MTARQKFEVGARVRLTAEAKRRRIRCFTGGRGVTGEQVETGIVTGFGRAAGEGYMVVKVRPDGSKTSKDYHMDSWEPIPAEEQHA